MGPMENAPPANSLERQWITDRLETLSVKERYQLAAALVTKGILAECAGKQDGELGLAVSKLRPDELRSGINCLLSLPEYEVLCPAGSDEQLGEYYLRHKAGLPSGLLPFAELETIGRNYEERHSGVFVGDCFVVLPRGEPRQLYDGTNLDRLPDTEWSLRLKLASPAVPEGVWLCLPDGDIEDSGKLNEIGLALRALKVTKIQECSLLDIRCSLPEISVGLDEYQDLADLIYDGNDLGYVLQEQGQGERSFLEKFRAALEYERCHDLRLALDIAQNLNCYDFCPASEALRKWGGGLKGDPILAGRIDLKAYGEMLLEQAGYELNAAETAYLRRSGQQFFYERSQPRAEQGMTMQ